VHGNMRCMTPTADVPTLSILLDAHDEQVRGTIATRLPTGWVPEWDGPLLRVTTPMRGFGFARDLEALSVDDLDALIGRTRDFFAQRGESVEWKTYGHDRADLTERLSPAGFEPEGDETVVIGRAADLAATSGVIDGVSIRATTDPADLGRIAEMESEVWGQDWSWLADDLANRITSAPDNIDIFVAEAEGRVVSAAWLVSMPGTEFNALWGGSTLAAWRRRGIYRALVARRAQVAVERGVKYLLVDASDDSSPILQRLGMHQVATTTPGVWTPRD